MEFSLAGNSLDSYINPASSSSHNNSDSLRTISDLGRLEVYFREKKEANAKIIDQLWARIEQSEAKCLQLTDSVDLSYSRINEDKALNIERYEDLLPFSFKEVEWANSSRVATIQPSNKAKTVEKYEISIDNLQTTFQSILEEQSRNLSNLEGDFYCELKRWEEHITGKQSECHETVKKLQIKLLEVEQSIQKEQQSLDIDLHQLYSSLNALISNKITEIDEQVIRLSS